MSDQLRDLNQQLRVEREKSENLEISTLHLRTQLDENMMEVTVSNTYASKNDELTSS